MTAYIIWLLCSIVFIGFGIYTLRLKKPAGFWTIKHEIEVTDVKKYNMAVAKLWFCAAGIFMIIGLPLFTGQNSPLIALTILGSVFASILFMIVYTRIEKKYRINK